VTDKIAEGRGRAGQEGEAADRECRISEMPKEKKGKPEGNEKKGKIKGKKTAVVTDRRDRREITPIAQNLRRDIRQQEEKGGNKEAGDR
jgi:hypothetical protein